MYHDEKIIDGILHHRRTPDGPWVPYTLRGLTAVVVDRAAEIAGRDAEISRLQAGRDAYRSIAARLYAATEGIEDDVYRVWREIDSIANKMTEKLNQIGCEVCSGAGQVARDHDDRPPTVIS